MPARYKDYPIYTYDEPITYSDFSGGINTDPSNEHLMNKELRDCVNMTYLSGALVKRKGAKELCKISCSDELNFIQGIFLFNYKLTYLIIAADGRLYKGVYNENITIKMERLDIYNEIFSNTKMYNESNPFEGLEELNDEPDRHDGFINTQFINLKTNEKFKKTNRNSFYDITGLVSKGDVVIASPDGKDALLQNKYVCIKNFDLEPVTIDESTNWIVIQYNDIPEDKVIYDYDPYKIEAYDSNAIYRRKETINGNESYRYYKIKESKYNPYYYINKKEFFIRYDLINTIDLTENNLLIFQNHRKINAATYDNALYIATGTRIIKVYVQNNDLVAKPLIPYTINYNEMIYIGYNYLSPYPEKNIGTEMNSTTTSVSSINVTKNIGGTFTLSPVMTFRNGDAVNDYLYRWEKFYKGKWYVLITFASQDSKFNSIDGVNNDALLTPEQALTITVNDADKFQYRFTFGQSFKNNTTAAVNWSVDKKYKYGDYVSNGARVYKCILDHSIAGRVVTYENNMFSTTVTLTRQTSNGNEVSIVQAWQEVYEFESLPFLKNENGTIIETTISDYSLDYVAGTYTGSVTSVLYVEPRGINDKFKVINSCTNVLVDGEKILYYGDSYNSGQWFKTIIKNPAYISDVGCLSFKTTKNEAVIKVVPFQGNLIVFANSENVGGSIHIVTGNGDDYHSENDNYFSPYQRRTISTTVTCDNENTVQTCDNILLFKYFKRIYYISASDLSNDVITVTPCNDKVITSNNDVSIPWEDNSCISEVTNDHYSLIWKEKTIINDEGELEIIHPAMRLKMYYKMPYQNSKTNSISIPWLRDESNIFNIDNVIYIKGEPVYLYKNKLITLSEDYYKDLNEDFEWKIKMKGYDLELNTMMKFINSLSISFMRESSESINLNIELLNESGHLILDNSSMTKSSLDLKTLFAGAKANEIYKLGHSIQDIKKINAKYLFPLMLAELTLSSKHSGSFSLSSVTYEYTSTETPDTTPYDIYSGIIRR